MIRRIVSGGQTGVDRAALDAAIAAGIETGGWCPRGRRAEDGLIAPRYPLQETPRSAYRQRTAWNVRDSDGTLILHAPPLAGGTALTAEIARELARALRIVDLDAPADHRAVIDWIAANGIAVLNVAGPRESTHPGIGARARAWLDTLFQAAPGGKD